MTKILAFQETPVLVLPNPQVAKKRRVFWFQAHLNIQLQPALEAKPPAAPSDNESKVEKTCSNLKYQDTSGKVLNMKGVDLPMVCGSPREVCQAPHVSSLSSSRHRPARVWQVILQFGWPNLSLKSETWEDLLPFQTRKNIEMILKNQRSRWKEIAHDDPGKPHCITTYYSLLDLFTLYRVYGPLL